MIIFEKQGNLFDTTLQTLVCPVNTVGVMGKGLAKEFKDRYPRLLNAYRKACNSGVFHRQGYWVWTETPDNKVLCLPSKQHWRNPSKVQWIDRSLMMIAQSYQDHGITSMAITPVGCGEGGLDWKRQVRPLIYEHLGGIPLEVGIYA